MQMAQGAPQIYNLPKLHRQMLDVIGIPNAADIVPTEDDQKPKDPISENMGFLKGKPTKAFIYQDHASHIQVHQSMMQDPQLQAQIGQSPMGQQMMPAIMAHIAEHLAFQYRERIEQQLGVPLPPPDQELPQDVEVQLSALVAQAAQQVLQQSQSQAAQQQAQQQQQDPLIQMQQAQIQIQQQEAATKAKKVDGDLAIKQAELQIKAQQSQQKGNPQLDAQIKMAQAQQQLQTSQQEHQQNIAFNSQQHAQSLRQQDEQNRVRLQQEQQLAQLRMMQEVQKMQLAKENVKQKKDE